MHIMYSRKIIRIINLKLTKEQETLKLWLFYVEIYYNSVLFQSIATYESHALHVYVIAYIHFFVIVCNSMFTKILSFCLRQQ